MHMNDLMQGQRMLVTGGSRGQAESSAPPLQCLIGPRPQIFSRVATDTAPCDHWPIHWAVRNYHRAAQPPAAPNRKSARHWPDLRCADPLQKEHDHHAAHRARQKRGHESLLLPTRHDGVGPIQSHHARAAPAVPAAAAPDRGSRRS